MPAATFEGIIRNGQVLLRGNVHLAENIRAYIINADAQPRPAPHLLSPHLANPGKAFDFKKQIVELPTTCCAPPH